MFIAAQLTIAKCWKQPQCPSVNEWIKKTMVHLLNGYYEYYAAERKKEPSAPRRVTAWVELKSIILSKISQVVKDKYHMI